MQKFAARANAKTVKLHAVTKSGYKAWLAKQAKTTQNWLAAMHYQPKDGAVAVFPKRDGSLSGAVLGLGGGGSMWSYSSPVGKLPPGRYSLEGEVDDPTLAALGWALATYDFSRYRKAKRFPSLVWPEGADHDAAWQAADAIALGRDLVNTPAGDLGPAELVQAVKDIAVKHGAKTKTIKGDKLITEGYPAVHAVGRASSRAPHLVDLRWGNAKHKKVTLVGKGVVFDSGGLDLKSAAGMKLMKKDMGGAASVLALADMVMGAGLPVQLRLLIPAVENAIGGDAFRPLDVLQTRKGLTVEVGNTDAEGRLILCDALAEADSEKPDLIIDFATLTGAARVALGTELPALFSSDDELARDTLEAGLAVQDPLWHMPLHRAYTRHLDSRIADTNNIGNVSQGGAITAALFLSKFVSRRTKWMHVDTMAYNNSNRAGRPQGGEIFGARAMFEMLRRRYPG